MTSRSHHRLLLAALLVAGLLAVVPVGTTPSTAAGTDTGFRVVGKLPARFEPNESADKRKLVGWLILDPIRRTGYQVFEMTNQHEPGSAPWTVIQSFNLDTLEFGKRRRINGLVPLKGRYSPENAAGVHAVDGEGGRIFLAMSDNPSAPPHTLLIMADGQLSFSTVVVIDERLFASDASDAEVFANRLSHPTQEHKLLAENHGLKGMRYVGPPGQGKLLMLWADWVPVHVSPRLHQLMQWGVDRPTLDSWTAPGLLAQPCGRAPLNGAGEPKRSMYPLDILPGPGYIALACQKSEGVTQVLKVHLAANGRPDTDAKVELHSLPRKYSDTIADVRGERLLVKTQYMGNSWWVWDARASDWAGSIGVVLTEYGIFNAAGFDPESGRLYTLAPNSYYPNSGELRPSLGGFGFADTRLTPAPQLQVPLPELAYPSVRRIEVDPKAPGGVRRLFVRRGTEDATHCVPPLEIRDYPCSVEDHWLVIEDSTPISPQPSRDEVDRLTTDVDERAGVTAANLDRSAAGFGARVMLVSGASGATTRTFDDGAQGIVHRSSCPPADRDLVLGQVSSARVGNVAASAQSTSLHADATTAADAADPVHRCWPDPKLGTLPDDRNPAPPEQDLPGLVIKTVSASCTGEQRARPQPLAGPPTQEAEAGCGHAAGTFDASAAVRGTTIGALTVGEASSRAWVEHDPERGRVTKVESVARNVVLGDLGTIGLVRTTAAAWTGGRPGTAGTSFTRDICGVSIVVQEHGCLDDAQKSSLARNVTSGSGGLVELRLRNPDESLSRGSPGGYQAAVQRTAGERFVDTAMSRDHSTVVPGLELVVYRDDGSYGPAREIVQLAGVQASSQYGIYCLFGTAPSGKACNTSALGPVDVEGEPTSGAEAFSSGYLADAADSPSSSFESASPIAATDEDEESGNPVARLLRRLAQVPADVLRLIASGPAELLLTAGMWLLLWLPCCVFERRRAARRALRGAAAA